MVRASDLDHLKSQFFHPGVVLISKGYFQLDLTNWIRRLTGHHAMENSIGLAEVLINQPHTTEGLIIEDVDATTSIHGHFSEFISTNLRCHHQGQVTRIINPGRVIFPTP